MMDFDELMELLRQGFQNQSPFVVYHKPESEEIRAWLASDARFSLNEPVSEPGFVFAPFDPGFQTVLFPRESSEILKAHWTGEDTGSTDPAEPRPANHPLQTSGSADGAGRSEHLGLVQETIDFIRSGEATKIVVSRREEVELRDLDPLGIFRTLVQKYPGAFVYLWYHPGVGMWAGASPEVLLKMKDEFFQTMSLAGTRSYKGEEEISWGAKELEEQQLVTGLIQKELKPYLTHVGSAYDQRAGQLVHLRTDISGRIPAGFAPGRIIVKLHPTAAVCGIPREKAMDFILKKEGYQREYYTGYLGEFLAPDDGESNLFVNLRCMKLLPEQQKAWIYVGGGITASSDAAKEWEETVAKSSTMKKAFS
jgi:isochorismate synthase